MDFLAALILGLAGSLHCAGMCGPLAIALPSTGPGKGGFLAGRLAYNGGRILTYCVIGVVLGGIGQTLFMAGLQRWVSIGLGVALLAGLVASLKWRVSGAATAVVSRLKASMSSVLRRRSTPALLLLGVLNGWLPCGLVYVAGANAAATGSMLGGLEYMIVFGAGTVPMMLGIGLSGRLLAPSWRLRLVRLIPISVAVLGGLLILRGLALGIPYLSPDLAADGGCCHK